MFDTRQMLADLMMKTNTTKQSLITEAAAAEAFKKGVCVGKPSLDMSFSPNSVELVLGDNVRDVQRIVFDVDLTDPAQETGSNEKRARGQPVAFSRLARAGRSFPLPGIGRHRQHASGDPLGFGETTITPFSEASSLTGRFPVLHGLIPI